MLQLRDHLLQSVSAALLAIAPLSCAGHCTTGLRNAAKYNQQAMLTWSSMHTGVWRSVSHQEVYNTASQECH